MFLLSTLDTLLDVFPAPELVKIDIEGAELLALQSASRLIGQVRPIFYVEVGSEVAGQIRELFHAADYLARNIADGDLTASFPDSILFVPSERSQRLSPSA